MAPEWETGPPGVCSHRHSGSDITATAVSFLLLQDQRPSFSTHTPTLQRLRAKTFKTTQARASTGHGVHSGRGPPAGGHASLHEFPTCSPVGHAAQTLGPNRRRVGALPKQRDASAHGPTSIRKSPVRSPACHATPPSSTDSRYCRAGKAGVGVNSSMGVSAGKTRAPRYKPGRCCPNLVWDPGRKTRASPVGSGWSRPMGLDTPVMGQHRLRRWSQLHSGATVLSFSLFAENTEQRAPRYMSICTRLSFSLKASVTKHFQF